MQCNAVRKYFADYVKESLDSSAQAELARHLKECPSCTAELEGLTEVWVKLGTLPAAEPCSPDMDIRFHMAVDEQKRALNHLCTLPHVNVGTEWLRRPSLIAVSVVLLMVVSAWLFRTLQQNSPHAFVETVDGTMYRVVGERTEQLRSGDRIRFGDGLQSNGGTGAILALADGSRVEMKSQSAVSLEKADDGVLLRLTGGSIIVTAAKQRNGHLYVQTKDVMVAVVGTVFLVNAEETGTRVAVIQGEVQVRQGSTVKKLLPGEQVATAPSMEWKPVVEEISWSRSKATHIALLQSDAKTAGKAPAAPAFEAASVKPNKETGRGLRGGSCRGTDSNVSGALFAMARLAGGSPPPLGRCILTRMTLKELIDWAFLPPSRTIGIDKRIIGGPSWTDSDAFDIEAKAENPASTTEAQLRQMLQTLLVDRFKLAFHRETREVSGYGWSSPRMDISSRRQQIPRRRRVWDESCHSHSRPATRRWPIL